VIKIKSSFHSFFAKVLDQVTSDVLGIWYQLNLSNPAKEKVDQPGAITNSARDEKAVRSSHGETVDAENRFLGTVRGRSAFGIRETTDAEMQILKIIIVDRKSTH